jgi:hypothetical protein
METSHYIDLIKANFKNPNTQKSYINRIKTLEATTGTTIHGILTQPEVWYPKIQMAYPSITTRKNMLTVVLALLKNDTTLKDDKAIVDKWHKLHSDLSRFELAKVKRSEPSDKQVQKYTSYEEIETKYEELKRRGSHATERESMQFLLLSILVHLRPKRADLGAIKIYYENDPRKTDENYIVLRKKGSSFIAMNVYKTSTYHQTVEEDLPEGLVSDIQTSIRRWPREYLFRKDDGLPMSNNTYSAFVKSTFEKIFGRATGVSLLRHIYITEKLNYENMTLEEQDTEAKLMLHTAGLQHQYKWPKKTICPKLCAAYIQPTKRTRKIRRSKKRPEES